MKTIATITSFLLASACMFSSCSMIDKAKSAVGLSDSVENAATDPDDDNDTDNDAATMDEGESEAKLRQIVKEIYDNPKHMTYVMNFATDELAQKYRSQAKDAEISGLSDVYDITGYATGEEGSDGSVDIDFISAKPKEIEIAPDGKSATVVVASTLETTTVIGNPIMPVGSEDFEPNWEEHKDRTKEVRNITLTFVLVKGEWLLDDISYTDGTNLKEALQHRQWFRQCYA